MRRVIVTVIREYTVDIDMANEIIEDYSNEDELIQDLASYNFNVLPVITAGAVKLIDNEIVKVSSRNS